MRNVEYVDIPSKEFQQHMSFIENTWGQNTVIYFNNINKYFKPYEFNSPPVGYRVYYYYAISPYTIISKFNSFINQHSLINPTSKPAIKTYKISEINPFKLKPSIYKDIKHTNPDNVLYYHVITGLNENDLIDFKNYLSIYSHPRFLNVENQLEIDIISKNLIIQHIPHKKPPVPI